MPSILSVAFLSQCLLAAAQLASSSLESHVDVLELGSNFDPVKPAYWTNLPHHRRTPFAVSPNGKSAYLAYLDSSETDVHVLEVNPSTFAAVGTPVTVTGGKEAGGLVAQDDGFALLTNIPVTGTDAPPGNTPVPVIVRYQSGKESWRTFVAGPGVHESDGLSMAPDMNGDLVWSEKAQLYGAYFVVTDYTGFAEGHFGDSIEYVDDAGKLQDLPESSAWGCSHNTGIAFEAADAVPFASICAEDHGSIWLNTETRGMSGVKISGENTTNGASGEPMGGMSGSYSSLARFADSEAYVFAWATRGCIDLTADTWLGGGNTQCLPRTMNHNVAISLLKDKQTLVGEPAISTVGAVDGDKQLTLITDDKVDHSNVHVAAFDASSALVTWEEIADPSCTDIAMGCSGTFTGSKFQQIDSTGSKIGDAVTSQDVYVSGDIVNIGSKLCWPYVSMDWSLSKAVGYGQTTATVSKMSFACIGGSGNSTADDGAGSSSSASSASATTAQSTPSAAATSSVPVATPTTASEIGTMNTSNTLSTATSPSVISTVTTPAASAASSISSVDSQEPSASLPVISIPAATATTLQTSLKASSASLHLSGATGEALTVEPSLPTPTPVEGSGGDDECAA